MNALCPVLAVAALALGGCVSTADRTRTNLAHAYVTPWTRLSAADHAAVVRLISERDLKPILGISAHPVYSDGSTLSAYTGDLNQQTYQFWHGYHLKREAEGNWRVTFEGECSHTIADLDLSGQLREFEQQRHR